jgi:hypothetical protein
MRGLWPGERPSGDGHGGAGDLAYRDVLLLIGEATLYFAVMATLFRMRRQFGLGVFVCALGSLHFL